MFTSGLADLLCDAGTQHPDQLALVTPVGQITYRELHRRAVCLAGCLIESGVKSGDRVIICLRKGPELSIAIFGTLLAGGCYVPIDYATPPARIRLIALDAEPVAVISTFHTGQSLFDDISVTPAMDAVAGLDKQTFIFMLSHSQNNKAFVKLVSWERAMNSAPPSSLPAADPTGKAYILYTSGSTGRPKGVVHTHESALTFVSWATDNLQLQAKDVLSQHASPSFDLTIFDFFASVRAAATLVSIPEWTFGRLDRIFRFIVEKGITVWYSVPSALLRQEGIARFGQLSKSALRRVVFAGEVIPVHLLRELVACLPLGCTVSNWYGPTETNVITHHDISSFDLESDKPIPIGRPCDYAQIRIVAEADAGETSFEGELWADSPTVMQGYWKLDDVNAKSCAVRSDGHYKTGDLVIEEEGQLTFLGRKDRLLKVRGYRLQPEEIEHVLQGHEDVLEAAVIAIREDGVENIAGLVATAKLDDPLLTDLKSLCEELLPSYMVPSRIVRVPALPRNERGKIDFRTIQHLFSPDAEQNSLWPAREA